MSRDIRFRAWDKIHNKMSNNFTLLSGINQDQAFVNPENFDYMQYTGLKDVEGREVYEGDLFGTTNLQDEFELVGEVIFDTDLAQFTIKYTNGGWAELWQHLNEKRNKAREVIGNIYENPTMLIDMLVTDPDKQTEATSNAPTPTPHTKENKENE